MSKIALILCSSRQPRVNPQIASFVHSIITTHTPPPTGSITPSITLIDLADRNLPMFDESTIPSQITNPADYSQPHTRAWSEEISQYSAFIFVTPQYNWGYPAVVKNAIDYLFNEWKGKPAMVVSYGGHGGDKANAQLRQVLRGVRMVCTERNPELVFPGREVVGRAARGEALGLDAGKVGGLWGEMRGEIGEAFGELVQLMSADLGGK